MLKVVGGKNVKAGFYWDVRKWELFTIPREGGVLPGGAEQRYLKVPVLGFLVVAPIMGFLYVIFLPVVGFAMVFGFVGQKTGAAVRTGFMELATTVSPHWRPGEAYLAGKRKAKEQADKAPGVQHGAKDERLERLQEEIDAKRKNGL